MAQLLYLVYSFLTVFRFDSNEPLFLPLHILLFGLLTIKTIVQSNLFEKNLLGTLKTFAKLLFYVKHLETGIKMLSRQTNLKKQRRSPDLQYGGWRYSENQ